VYPQNSMSLGLSNEGFNHIINQIFKEPMEENVEIPVEIQRDMVVTPRYKTGKGPQDRPKKLSKYYANSWITGVGEKELSS